jgi:hypothetical protein
MTPKISESPPNRACQAGLVKPRRLARRRTAVQSPGTGRLARRLAARTRRPVRVGRVFLAATLAAALFFLFLGDLEAQESRLPRVILGLYDSTEPYNRRPDHNLIHKNAAMVLNYLGMKMRYHDIAQGLPGEKELEDVHGILTWFMDEEMAGAEAYCRWAANEIQKGKKFVILGNMGAWEDQKTKETVPLGVAGEIYRALGLEYEGDWTDNPLVIEVSGKDPRMVEFERTLDQEAGVYERIVSSSPENRVYLTLRRSDLPGSESAAVVVTPRGGVAVENYVILLNHIDETFRWRLNPFLFFEEAFGLEGGPRYDTTTLFGRRIFYSHIDGDGFENAAEFDPAKMSAEVVRDDILEKYDLPVTVSVVTSEVDPRYMGSERTLAVARSIFSLPHVEAGSHGFAHPLDWEKKLASYEIKGYSRKLLLGKDPALLTESPYKDAAKILASDDAYLKREIVDTVRYIESELLPKKKRVVLFQWTGDCKPPGEAIGLADGLGIGNINGGDGRFDRSTPSYTAVAPLVREMDGRVQVYTSNANENIYTNGWDPPYDALRHVIETFEQTEVPTLVDSVPRRVSPINVYYHFYSGEKRMSLQALRQAYDYVLKKKVIPVFASDYVEVVRGFHSGFVGRLGQAAAGGWRFSGYGACRTVRWDARDKYPDLARSKGVLGFSRWENYLYVHLDDSGEAVIYFQDKPPSESYLEESSTLISTWKVSREEGSFTARGFGEGFWRILNMAPDTPYGISFEKPGVPDRSRKKTVRADAAGVLEIREKIEGELQVRLAREK